MRTSKEALAETFERIQTVLEAVAAASLGLAGGHACCAPCACSRSPSYAPIVSDATCPRQSFTAAVETLADKEGAEETVRIFAAGGSQLI